MTTSSVVTKSTLPACTTVPAGTTTRLPSRLVKNTSPVALRSGTASWPVVGISRLSDASTDTTCAGSFPSATTIPRTRASAIKVMVDVKATGTVLSVTRALGSARNPKMPNSTTVTAPTKTGRHRTPGADPDRGAARLTGTAAVSAAGAPATARPVRSRTGRLASRGRRAGRAVSWGCRAGRAVSRRRRTGRVTSLDRCGVRALRRRVEDPAAIAANASAAVRGRSCSADG